MKFSVITNSKGKVVAIVPTGLTSYDRGAPRLDAPMAGRGNKIREIELPDRPLEFDSAAEIRAQIETVIKYAGPGKSSSGPKTRKSSKSAARKTAR